MQRDFCHGLLGAFSGAGGESQDHLESPAGPPVDGACIAAVQFHHTRGDGKPDALTLASCGRAAMVTAFVSAVEGLEYSR